MARTKMLLLEYDATTAAQGTSVVCALAGPVPYSNKEPVGHIFHYKVLLQQGLIDPPADESSSSDDDSSSNAGNGTGVHTSSSVASNLDDMQPPPGVSWKKSKGKKKQVKSKEVDYYALLGLQHERFMATEAQLKQAYRKACLEHHPDKKLVGVDCDIKKTEAEEHFKKIQEAYDTLLDPAKRREYDSTDEFDDSLPLDCDPADFFKVFAPAFRRNARWSVEPKVPDVGDESTAYEDVSKFYDFWYGFKSWREFPHPDEEDVEGAESREHRRWIERINAKLREKGKKDEAKRLREFVDAAYRLDPRIIGYKQQQAAERERKKAEKAEARRLQLEEEQRQKDEEEARKRAEEEAAKAAAAEAKKAREAEKKLIKKERQRLRAIASGGDEQQRLLSEDDTEKLCQSLDLQQLQQLCDSASAAGLDAAAKSAVLADAVRALQSQAEREAAEKEQKRKEAEQALKDLAKRDHAKKVKEMREWSDDELRMLDKAVKKFPMGTPRRWEQVAAYVRTRTLDEVLLMVKEHQGASSTRMHKQEDWKGAAKKRAEVTSAADTREAAFTDVQIKLAAEAAAADAAAAAAAAAAADSSNSSAASSRRSSSAGGAAAVAAADGASKPSAAAAAAPAGAAAPKPKKVVAESGEWTEEQELALVQALKQFGKELPDRWDQIATVVPGKSKAACFKRFKELRDVFRAKKGGDA